FAKVSRLRDEVVVLKKQQFESAHVVSKLVADLDKAKDGQGFRESLFGCDLKDEDSRLLKDRFEEKEVVYLSTEASLRSEIDVLNHKIKLANQEQSLLVRYFFPHAVERLLSSDLFSFVLADLQEKAMLVEVASSGVDLELEDMKDFDPNVEETYDRAIDAFYQ
ncbi:hypothetical protein Tco_0113496, partial [Tanacetum coccineum]